MKTHHESGAAQSSGGERAQGAETSPHAGATLQGAMLQRKIQRRAIQRKDQPIPEGAITVDKLDGATEFEKKVFLKQQQWAIANKTFFKGIPPADLEVVENGQSMKKDAADDCKTMLAKARADLATEQGAKDAHALKVKSIGCASGYRSPEGDKNAWQNSFETQMKTTEEERKKLDGGEFGAKAVDLMVQTMIPTKAIPGFSNHTNGIAMDFSTTEKGLGDLGPSKAQKPLWQKSWLYAWLVAHAGDYKFIQLPSEEWHWDHNG